MMTVPTVGFGQAAKEGEHYGFSYFEKIGRPL